MGSGPDGGPMPSMAQQDMPPVMNGKSPSVLLPIKLEPQVRGGHRFRLAFRGLDFGDYRFKESISIQSCYPHCIGPLNCF